MKPLDSKALSGLLLIWLATLPGPVGCQSSISGQDTVDQWHQSDTQGRLEVYLMVFGPGASIVARYGHSAIWIRDQAAGTNIAYNYGMSLLPLVDSPAGIRSLVRNEVAVRPTRGNPLDMITAYATQDRDVELLKLNLSQVQALVLQDNLEADQAPDRPPSRQDFYRNNCTTGVRDSLDRALGGQIKDATADVIGSQTLRSHSLRYVSDSPLLYVGMLLGMGGAVDHVPTQWDEMFMPELLARGLRTMMVETGSGAVPLVASSENVYTSTRPRRLPRPPVRWPFFLGCGLFIGSAITRLGEAPPGATVRRIGFALVSGTWLVVVGAVGLALSGLWGLTQQHLTYQNENLLQANPLALVVGWLVLTGSLTSAGEARTVRRLATLLALVSIVGLILKAHPAFAQANTSVLLFSVPVYIGFLRGMARWEVAPEAPK